MPRFSIALVLLLGGFAHISEPAPQPGPVVEDIPYPLGPLGPTETVSGLFVVAFEQFYIAPEGTSERWWLSGNVDWRGLTKQYDHILYVTFRGRKTEPGHYGHVGAYPREFVVEEIIAARCATKAELLRYR